MSGEREVEITKIIDSLVTTGKKTLEESLMKKLKNICKSSPQYVSYTYYALMTQLKKEHSEVRYSVLLIINELFNRSSVLRKLLENDLELFLQLVAETDPELPLPLPKTAAKNLKLKGLEFMKAWTTKFGHNHIRLELALTYLQKCRKVDFNDMEARSIAERERLQQEQERQERIINEKVSKVKSEMQEITEEITNTVLQMENCFRLLVPHPDEFFTPEDFSFTEEQNIAHIEEKDRSESPVDCEMTNEESLRQHGLYSMKKGITIEVKQGSEVGIKANEDTQPIIENLIDLFKEMNTRYFPTVNRWLKILTKGSNCTDTLKKAIDLKQRIVTAFEKYKELKIKTDMLKDGDDDDEDDFIEVRDKEGYEETVKAGSSLPAFLCQPSSSKTLTEVESASKWKLKHSQDDIKDPTSAASTLIKRNLTHCSEEPSCSFSTSTKLTEKKSRKADLLEKAPVLPYDIDLYHWEDEKPVVPEKIKFDSLHKFWESKDEEEENEALREVQVASLRTRKIDFSGKFEPVKWACRAPLPSGKLCPRKDRIKCPFHGDIIKRDASGNPVDPSTSAAGPSTSSASTVPDWQDPSLLKDIQAATGMNLKIPEKKTRGKKKECGLTNLRQVNTARDRLSKKIDKRYKHYAKKIDEMERKRFNDKFGDQWNYY